MNLHSENIPEIPYSPDITDLFTFFGINWNTLGPVLWLLFGVLFAFIVLKVLKQFNN